LRRAERIVSLRKFAGAQDECPSSVGGEIRCTTTRPALSQTGDDDSVRRVSGLVQGVVVWLMPFKNKEDRQAFDREYRRQNKDTRTKQRRLVEALKDAPCMDCGGKFPPECMDFDHVRGEKLFSIAACVSGGKSQAHLLVEIAKCDLVCANCHRIRTRKRGMDYNRKGGRRMMA